MSENRFDNPIFATLGALQQRIAGTAASRLRDDDRLEGLALVTGANRGLGVAVAEALAARGAEVILAGRTAATNTRRTIREAGGKAWCEHVDLADLESVFDLAERLERVSLDAVILNAGVVTVSGRSSAQGFELQNAINYLANVALLDRLVAQGSLASGARVVAVSSESHRSIDRIDLDALGVADSYGMSAAVERYSYTKLLLTTWARHMSRELDDVAVHSMCPGPVQSGIAREAPKLGQLVLEPIMRLFFADPTDAAGPVVYLACARELEGRTGLYFHRWDEKAPAPAALDTDEARRLVEHSRALIRERTQSP